MQNSIFSNFWKIFLGYWNGDKKWKARSMLVTVVLLNLLMVYLLVKINEWYKTFYDALQSYKLEAFWPLVGEFTALAFIYIIIAVYAIYIRQMLSLEWRTWMTSEYLNRWLKEQTYYRVQVLQKDTDNPDQRISEDINQFTNITLNLLLGFIKQMTTLGAFGVVLWNLSGEFKFSLGSQEFVIYGYMFWFSLIYSILGTGLAHIVGKKLIRLNFEQQRYEADFRFSMMRMRENSESIAFYKGESAENIGFKERFFFVINNYWKLMKQTKFLNFYVNSYSQLAVIVPLILAAPNYFAGAIALGGLMQTVSAFGRVQDALSYFIESYDTLAQLAAVTKRLSEFNEHVEEVIAVKGNINFINNDSIDDIVIPNLNVKLPDNTTLFSVSNLVLEKGSSILITGVSGVGKSTLMRTLAGIWPYGDGYIENNNNNRVLFLPQRPYLPLGTLRRAIGYPLTVYYEEVLLENVLKKVGLEHFIGRLDNVDDWSRILSLGEQQRLAFARLLLYKPDIVYLDEATSALDEHRELVLYNIIKTELPCMTVISIGHRSTLREIHSVELLIENKVIKKKIR